MHDILLYLGVSEGFKTKNAKIERMEQKRKVNGIENREKNNGALKNKVWKKTQHDNKQINI